MQAATRLTHCRHWAGDLRQRGILPLVGLYWTKGHYHGTFNSCENIILTEGKSNLPANDNESRTPNCPDVGGSAADQLIGGCRASKAATSIFIAFTSWKLE